MPVETEPEQIEESVQEIPDKDEDYNELWAKKSNKPLPQIYGHIDRISSAEAGSLLDRYADRFGHALDRDIIVLRKQQHELIAHYQLKSFSVGNERTKRLRILPKVIS